jgi:hypothetical protein
MSMGIGPIMLRMVGRLEKHIFLGGPSNTTFAVMAMQMTDPSGPQCDWVDRDITVWTAPYSPATVMAMKMVMLAKSRLHPY